MRLSTPRHCACRDAHRWKYSGLNGNLSGHCGSSSTAAAWSTLAAAAATDRAGSMAAREAPASSCSAPRRPPPAACCSPAALPVQATRPMAALGAQLPATNGLLAAAQRSALQATIKSVGRVEDQ